jgi:hypothetical protein
MTEHLSDEALMEYMETKQFRRRAAKLQARIVGGERPSFEEIAHFLRLPLHVVVDGFKHSVTKAGVPVQEATAH